MNLNQVRKWRHSDSTRTGQLIIVEFTRGQALFWGLVFFFLLAASFFCGSRFFPCRDSDSVPVAPETMVETGSPSPPAALHPPYARAHEEPISAVAVSPDGAYLATTSWDSTIKLWDVRTGERVNRCRVGDIVWHALILSPGGRFAACSRPFQVMKEFGFDHDMHLFHVWDLHLETLVLELDDPVEAFAFSPDGKRLGVLGSQDLHLYNTETWQLLELFPIRDGNQMPFNCAAIGFDEDGESVTILDLERRISIHPAQGAHTVCHAENPADIVYASAVLAAPPFLAAFVTPSGCVVRKFASGGVLEVLAVEDAYTGPMAFTPDGRYLALGHSDGWIDLLAVPGFDRIHRYTRLVEGLTALPDSRHFIAQERYHVSLFSIEGAPLIRYFSDEINPEHYRIRKWGVEGHDE